MQIGVSIRKRVGKIRLGIGIPEPILKIEYISVPLLLLGIRDVVAAPAPQASLLDAYLHAIIIQTICFPKAAYLELGLFEPFAGKVEPLRLSFTVTIV